MSSIHNCLDGTNPYSNRGIRTIYGPEFLMKHILQGLTLTLLLWVSLALGGKYAYALDDFDLAKYGPTEKVDFQRAEFILKIVTYTNRDRLNQAFEKATGKPLPEGSGVRGFTNVRPDEDICWVHIILADIWDDREAMAIMGHEVYHCTLADHKDVIADETVVLDAPKDTALNDADIEDLYAEDRRLELEWLKEDYESMGIEVN